MKTRYDPLGQDRRSAGTSYLVDPFAQDRGGVLFDLPERGLAPPLLQESPVTRPSPVHGDALECYLRAFATGKIVGWIIDRS
ncbi:hypothetical protein [Streptomyces sp. NPDC004680]|uniref:hypothetical protein n=1 Tax=Streptomyces sp. NPDC004680 TaxID=3154287 RepID=UPI00339DB32C